MSKNKQHVDRQEVIWDKRNLFARLEVNLTFATLMGTPSEWARVRSAIETLVSFARAFLVQTATALPPDVRYKAVAVPRRQPWNV